MRLLFFSVYVSLISALLLYGLHRYILLYLYFAYRRHTPTAPGLTQPLPRVTIQLPLYNEPHVFKHLLTGVCNLAYPHELLHIQVLDDSDDGSRGLIVSEIEAARAKGFAVDYLTRRSRVGFKAGALAQGLKSAKGEFIALFDADFVPYPAFLKTVLPFFVESRVGMVQARWRHENRTHSLFTRLQEMWMDGHFGIEQNARFRSGRFFNFNGSAGVWRVRCIIDSGGWQTDTIAEDLDLSYRAQLRGWRSVYIDEPLATAELPAHMGSFKRQQRRWVIGTLQVARKTMVRIVRGRYPLRIKIEAFLHLTNYMVYPLGLLATILILPAMHLRSAGRLPWPMWFDITCFLVLTCSVFLFHLASRQRRREDPLLKVVFIDIPALIAFSIGMSVNNSLATFEAFFKAAVPFQRTPKYGGGLVRRRRDHDPRVFLTQKMAYAEFFLGCYFLYALHYALVYRLYQGMSFLILFSWGFFYVALRSFIEPSPLPWEEGGGHSAGELQQCHKIEWQVL